MNKITKKLLAMLTDWKEDRKGAYNIREDGACVARQSTAHITIEAKVDAPGLEIHISPKAKNETVYIPACVTHGGVNDLVYNDFFVGPGADVTVIAGCGVETDSDKAAAHNGIHRFFLEKGAHVRYKEKHIGSGAGTGTRKINPVTEAMLGAQAVLEMETVQTGGVDLSQRQTRASLAAGARLTVHESIQTDGENRAQTDFDVSMDGPGCAANLISRSVARGNSIQVYHSRIKGNCRCSGHSECDAILSEHGCVSAAPELYAGDADAELIHEAAIGRIAGDQIIKLMTLGLTQKEAEEKIIEGFLGIIRGSAQDGSRDCMLPD